MRNRWKISAGVCAGFVAAGSLVVLTAQIPLPGQLPGVEPLHDSGQDVTPAFEGWFKNADGTFELLFGYNNRNLKQELDIPIGPANRIEPFGPDAGQPTHFAARRGWGVFTVKVPGRLAAAVREHARASGRTISAVVAQALEEFLARGRRNDPPG